MTEFTPVSAFLGGSLIGLSALILMLGMGRVAGCSGIITSVFTNKDRAWRVCFILGLILGPVAATLIGSDLPQSYHFNIVTLLVGGLLVGIGASLGSGCTSGHGICGMGRLSKRSIVATCLFMASASITVFVMRHAL